MAQVISTQLLASQRRVYVVCMDCFGAVQTISVSLLSGPTVADKIASVLASLTAAENAVNAYAASAEQDLTGQLATGQAAIDAAVANAAANGTAPSAA